MTNTKKGKGTNILNVAERLKGSFSNAVEVKYDMYNGCKEFPHDSKYKILCGGGVCRCGIIMNPVARPHYALLMEYLNIPLLEDIADYCAERVLFFNDILDPEKYRVDILNYTPQILGSLYFTYAPTVRAKLTDLWRLSANKQVEYVLKMEYGEVPFEAINCDWKVETVLMSNLYFENNNKWAKLDFEFVRTYALAEELDIPKAVVIFDDGQYKVIDGYHRLNNYATNQYVKMLVGYKKTLRVQKPRRLVI